MKLDLPTLAFLAGLTILAQVAALLVQFRSNRTYRGTGWWLAGAVAFAAGFIFLLVNAKFGFWWFGILGNPALIFAHMGLMTGTLRFLGRSERWPWPPLALAVAVAVYYAFLIPFPSISARTAVVSTAIALFDLATAGALLGREGRRYHQPARFTAAIFVVHGGFLLAVAGITLAHPPLRTYHDYSFFQTLAFVVPAVASTLWTFGFILLLNQRLEAERKKSQAEWRRAEREKTDLELQNRHLQKAESLARMAGAIAHHYNNRLQVVLGSLERLEAALPGAESARTLSLAKDATERAAELSQLMLVYLGQESQSQEPADLSALCGAFLPSLQAMLPAEVRLQAALPHPGPTILANAGQIQVALANLAGNAREALGEGGGELRIEVGRGPASAIPVRTRFPAGWQPQALDHAWVEVADTGVGIAPAALENVCDPFYSTKFPGRGLGLSVVLGIARAHGGGMTVTSEPGAGSAFRIHLPVAEGAELGGAQERA